MYADWLSNGISLKRENVASAFVKPYQQQQKYKKKSQLKIKNT